MVEVLFCGNSAVFDGVLTAMLSIFMRTKTAEPFHITIYTADLTRIKAEYTAISNEETAFLDGVAKKYNAANSVEKADVTALYEDKLGGCINEGCYCSPYTLLRLLSDEVSGVPGKLLYLDCDVLFNRDVMLLYNTDVSGVEYAAARDHYGKFLISRNFINAGVLLLNMDEIRRTGLFKRARDMLHKKKLLFADESALIKCTAKKLILSQRFNDQKFLYKDTVIRHFSRRLFYLPYPHVANIKQWQVTKVHKIFGYEAFDDILYEYVYLKRAGIVPLQEKCPRLTQ